MKLKCSVDELGCLFQVSHSSSLRFLQPLIHKFESSIKFYSAVELDDFGIYILQFSHHQPNNFRERIGTLLMVTINPYWNCFCPYFPVGVKKNILLTRFSILSKISSYMLSFTPRPHFVCFQWYFVRLSITSQNLSIIDITLD